MKEEFDIKDNIVSRVSRLYMVFVFIGIIIFVRIGYLQTGTRGDRLQSRAERINYGKDTLKVYRGDIISDDGRLMATTVPKYEIRMDLAAAGLTDEVFEAGVVELSRALAQYFKTIPEGEYEKMLRDGRAKGRRSVRLSPRGYLVNYEELDVIRKFPIFKLGANKGGFIAEQKDVRLRPSGYLAARTVGRIDDDKEILWGLERSFDSSLRAINGRTIKQKISGTFWIPVESPKNIEPIDGMDIISTINVDVQAIARNALAAQLSKVGADWGTAIVMEVQTGEIKALTNLTNRGGQIVEDLNYAYGHAIEPGSTMKLATLMILLEDAGMKLTDIVETGGGRERVGITEVVDTHGYGTLSLIQVFEKSSNVGFAKSVYRHYSARPEKYVDQVLKLGFGDTLKYEIDGTAPPMIKDPRREYNTKNPGLSWDGTTLARMAFGYALQITPIQIVTFYNAVANNGRMLKPFLVKRVMRRGDTVYNHQVEVLQEAICKPQTLKDVLQALVGVTEAGTAKFLANPNYTFAAKTGTAQVPVGRAGYRAGHYMGSMVGFFPADNPKYTCLVIMKTYAPGGSGKTYYGGPLAGPVLKAIADKLYATSPYFYKHVDAGSMNLPPLPDAGMMATATDTLVRTPNLRGMNLRDALPMLESMGFVVRYTGVGGITAQSVAVGDTVREGAEIILTLGKPIVADKQKKDSIPKG